MNTFICSYEVSYYPFDDHECKMELEVEKNDQRFFNLSQRNVYYNGSKELPSHLVDKISFGEKVRCKKNPTKYLINHVFHIQTAHGITIKIRVRQRLVNDLLTMIFPTMLIVMVCL